MLFDCVVIAPSSAGLAQLQRHAAAAEWVANAFNHLKVIAYTETAAPLLRKAGVDDDPENGVLSVDGRDWTAFVDQAKDHRVWAREAAVRPL